MKSDQNGLLYILFWRGLLGGKILWFAVCGLQFAVACCGCGRNLRQWLRIASENKRKGVKSGCALLVHAVYCFMLENNRIRVTDRTQLGSAIAIGNVLVLGHARGLIL
jgi:hypothetical protein